MHKIDFVIPWVDGSDINWINEKNKYDLNSINGSNNDARYRDWDNLKYWFRGVDKYAPWVNRVFFVTWGHVPAWLDTQHEKLKIVNHRDYIPEEYLPTFNSNVIELNYHRIPDLSEHFVLFNDDTFLIDHVRETDFFSDGKPCDEFIMSPIMPNYNVPIIGHTCLNNMLIINKHFDKRSVIKSMYKKVYSTKYRKKLFRNIALTPWPKLTGFFNDHIPISHLKSTFELMWEKEEEQMKSTCRNKFRTYMDINHWLMRYWNLCAGDFVPRKEGFGKMFTVTDDNTAITRYIASRKGKMICVNDSIADFDLERAIKEINEAFESIFPERSSFELDGGIL
ncbi:MAG: Stealth CR1 domain-containing protein [Lachnospiraceae bacterium]|nr:Stealth CR1 domain-containing protein [Lachnospiraceae bacterium]